MGTLCGNVRKADLVPLIDAPASPERRARNRSEGGRQPSLGAQLGNLPVGCVKRDPSEAFKSSAAGGACDPDLEYKNRMARLAKREMNMQLLTAYLSLQKQLAAGIKEAAAPVR